MRSRPTFARIILLVCLLTLQLQTFAASTLSCRHAADGHAAHCPHAVGAGPVSLTLPAASQDDSAPAASALLGECQKCMLDLCLVGALGLLPQPPLMAGLTRSAPTPGPEPYFYRYARDLWLKPPIMAVG
jgi:hypothetical protein